MAKISVYNRNQTGWIIDQPEPDLGFRQSDDYGRERAELRHENRNLREANRALMAFIPGTKFHMRAFGAKALEWCEEYNIAAKRMPKQVMDIIVIEESGAATLFYLQWAEFIHEQF